MKFYKHKTGVFGSTLETRRKDQNNPYYIIAVDFVNKRLIYINGNLSVKAHFMHENSLYSAENIQKAIDDGEWAEIIPELLNLGPKE